MEQNYDLRSRDLRLPSPYSRRITYATEEEAGSAVEGLVRWWEFGAALRAQSGEFRLQYAGADVIDLNPPPPSPGVVMVGTVTIRFGAPKVQTRLTEVVASYPAPPQDAAIAPDDPDAFLMRYGLDCIITSIEGRNS